MVSNREMGYEKNITEKVDRWLDNLSAGTARVNKAIFNNWMNWVRVNGGKFAEFTPEELVEYQQEAQNSHRYDIADLLKDYINHILKQGKRAGYQRKIISTIRSFFMHSRAEIPRDKTLNIRSEKQRVVGNITLDMAKTMITSCNPVYKAVYLSMLQAGMSIAGFEYWNLNGWESLKTQLKEDPDYVRIDLPGRKKMKFIEPYHTFIASDALAAVKNWLQHRPENAKAIFTNKNEEPIMGGAIQLYWMRHLRREGFVSAKDGSGSRSARYGKNVHELRTIWRSQWTKSGAHSSAGEYFMGHTVDKLDYDRAAQSDPEWAFKQYKKFAPYIQIYSNPDRAFGRVGEDEVERLRRELEEAKRGQSDVVQSLKAELDIIKRALSHPESGPLLWKALKELEEKTR